MAACLRSTYHLTLGELTDFLENHSRSITPYVTVDCGGAPGPLMGYFGHPEDLAFSPDGLDVSTEGLYLHCRTAIGREFAAGYGWHEGRERWVMGRETPLWVSKPEEASGVAVVGYELTDNNALVLLTKTVDY